jgi:hypothetical protein
MQGARVLVDATPTRVTTYHLASAGMVGRQRLDTSASPRTTGFGSAGSGDEYTSWWSAARVGSDEVLAIVAGVSPNDLVLRRTNAGDGTGLDDVGVISTATHVDQYANISLAVHDPTANVGPLNPLAVTWQQGSPDVPGNATQFAEITSFDPFVMSSPVSLAGSLGVPSRNFDNLAQAVVVVPAPGDTIAGRWFVVAREEPGTSVAQYVSITRAWEISPSAPMGRALAIPSEIPTGTTDLNAAVVGRVVRFATRSADGLSTRSIGCE